MEISASFIIGACVGFELMDEEECCEYFVWGFVIDLLIIRIIVTQHMQPPIPNTPQ